MKILNNDTGGPRISWFLVPNGNPEMRGSWIPGTVFSIKPQNGSKEFQKSPFWASFLQNFGKIINGKKIPKIFQNFGSKRLK